MARISFDAPESINVIVSGKTLTVWIAKLGVEAIAHCFEYGVRQKVADGGAGAARYFDHKGEPTADRASTVTVSDENREAFGFGNEIAVGTKLEVPHRRRPATDVAAEAIALAEKRLVALYAGEIRTREAGPKDPTLDALRSIVLGAWVKRGFKLKDAGKLPDAAACYALADRMGADRAKVDGAVKRLLAARAVEI